MPHRSPSLVLPAAALVGLAAAVTHAPPIAAGFPSSPRTEVPKMEMKQVTSVMMVESIEPVLPFWVDRLGFEVTQEVPHGDALGFVTLVRDDVELMYQSRASVAEDVPPLADELGGPTFLFLVVEELDAVQAALEGIEPVVPRRQTFYGADELIVRDPTGHVVTFAEFAEED